MFNNFEDVTFQQFFNHLTSKKSAEKVGFHHNRGGTALPLAALRHRLFAAAARQRVSGTNGNRKERWTVLELLSRWVWWFQIFPKWWWQTKFEKTVYQMVTQMLGICLVNGWYMLGIFRYVRYWMGYDHGWSDITKTEPRNDVNLDDNGVKYTNRNWRSSNILIYEPYLKHKGEDISLILMVFPIMCSSSLSQDTKQTQQPLSPFHEHDTALNFHTFVNKVVHNEWSVSFANLVDVWLENSPSWSQMLPRKGTHSCRSTLPRLLHCSTS